MDNVQQVNYYTRTNEPSSQIFISYQLKCLELNCYQLNQLNYLQLKDLQHVSLLHYSSHTISIKHSVHEMRIGIFFVFKC
jgi:hypothetical protein